MTKIYIDLEFNELTENAEAISFGAAAADGSELYMEFDPLPEVNSKFVQQYVLPLLSGDACRCRLGDFPERLQAWLQQFESPILFVADSAWDWFVLHRALGNNSAGCLDVISVGNVSVTPVTVHAPTGALNDIYETARLQVFLRDSRQHHALTDARALGAAEMSVECAHRSDTPTTSS